MARIILGSYMFRYPLGGMLSWVLQYLLGLKDLGHEVYFVEKYGYAGSCYNPITRQMSSNCSYGIKIVSELLTRFGFEGKWCFVSQDEGYHGLSKQIIEAIFRSADLFIDMGTHGSWAEESEGTPLRVLIDGEPGYTQINMANKAVTGIPIPDYDYYFTNGKNVGTEDNPTPTLGINWRHVYSPVKMELFSDTLSAPNAPYSTIMNWQSHAPIEYEGKVYGQKDIEFNRFLSLPKSVNTPMEVAVSGSKVPKEILKLNGWFITNAEKVTLSFDSFCQYISYCRGEFSVCKNVFVANSTGWFSDKSAAFLASGRPVVLQNTGFNQHLPVGEGLFAVNSVNEARNSIYEIERNYKFHCRKAKEIASEYLEAKKVMKTFLNELGL